MEIVTDKADLFTPAKRMFTVDGQMVQSLEELVDKEAYVAVEGSKYVAHATRTQSSLSCNYMCPTGPPGIPATQIDGAFPVKTSTQLSTYLLI